MIFTQKGLIKKHLQTNKKGKVIVEDTKSPVSKTPVYRLKKRLLAECYGIEIEEL